MQLDGNLLQPHMLYLDIQGKGRAYTRDCSCKAWGADLRAAESCSQIFELLALLATATTASHDMFVHVQFADALQTPTAYQNAVHIWL